MNVVLSCLKHVEEALKNLGFERRRWRHGILGTRIFNKGRRAIVVIPSIEIPPPSITPIHVFIDDYCRCLRDVLIGIMRRYNLTDLVFQAGGSIPLPDWFREWCKENGIRLHLIDPLDPKISLIVN